MNKKFLFIVVFPALTILVSCFLCTILLLFAFFSNRQTGETITEDREIEVFEELTFKGYGTIHLTQGEKHAVAIQTDQNTIKKITTEVVNNKLAIDYKRSTLWPFGPIFSNGNINIYITVPNLRSIDVDGAGRLQSDYFNTEALMIDLNGASKLSLEDFYADNITITASGASEINLSGAVMNQSITVEGASSYQAYNLTSRNCSVSLTGASKAEVFVSEALDVKISGAGKVTYKGTPADIKQDINGVGTVEKFSN